MYIYISNLIKHKQPIITMSFNGLFQLHRIGIKHLLSIEYY